LRLDLLLRDAGVNRRYRHFLRHRIGLKDAEVGDQPGRALGREPKPRAMVAALAMAHGGDEVELLGKSARRLAHDDEYLAAGAGDRGRAAAAREPYLGLVIIADHGGVEIGEAVDLRAAEEANRHASALQPVAKHLDDSRGGERGLAQLAIADRERQ